MGVPQLGRVTLSLASPGTGGTLEWVLTLLPAGHHVVYMVARKLDHLMAHRRDGPIRWCFRVTGNPIRLERSYECSRGWSDCSEPEDWKKRVAGIVVEAVEREAGVTSVGFGNQERFEGFQGQFQAPAGGQPRPCLYRDSHLMGTSAGTSIHPSSFQSRGRYRVSSVRQER